jgi:hypothetical protein
LYIGHILRVCQLDVTTYSVPRSSFTPYMATPIVAPTIKQMSFNP